MVPICCASLLQAALFCAMNVNSGRSSPWSPFAFTVQMKYVFLPDVPEMVFLSSIVCLSLSHTQMVLCIYFQCPFRARAMNWPFHRCIGGSKSHWTWLVASTVYRAIPPNFLLPLQGHWHVFTLKAQTLFIWPLISN